MPGKEKHSGVFFLGINRHAAKRIVIDWNAFTIWEMKCCHTSAPLPHPSPPQHPPPGDLKIAPFHCKPPFAARQTHGGEKREERKGGKE